MINTIFHNFFWLLAIFVPIIWLRNKGYGRGSLAIELFLGIILGNLSLLGIHYFEGMTSSRFLMLFSELAISFFLFRIGFASSVSDMLKIGTRAFMVALLGVSATFALAFYFVPFIRPGLSGAQYAFIAAALSTTSVGISARLLKDHNLLRTMPAKIIIGAAVFDDIISLLILAFVVVALPQATEPSGLLGVAGIMLFMVFGIVLGQIAARFLPKILHQYFPELNPGKIVVPLFFAAFFLCSKWAGISPVVGSFVGGLVIERKYFNQYGDHERSVRQTTYWVEKVSNLVLPAFFVLTGAQVNLSTLFSARAIGISLGLLVIAVIGKLACGLAVRKSDKPFLVSLAMIPRGEVGLVFANIAYSQNILPAPTTSAIVIVVLLTTFIAPLLLRKTIRLSA